jgi:hypothetical protein
LAWCVLTQHATRYCGSLSIRWFINVRGKSMEYIAALSESVHQALMEEFDVPALDKFQVVHEVECAGARQISGGA